MTEVQSYRQAVISPGTTSLFVEATEIKGGDTREKVLYDFDFRMKGVECQTSFAEKLCEVCAVFGASNLVGRSIRANVRAYCGSSDEVVFFSRSKKFCESFMARLMGTQHDAVPLFGAFKTWVEARLFRKSNLRHPSRESISLAQTLFKAKGLVGHASDRQVVISLINHRQTVIDSVADGSTVEEALSAIKPVLKKMMKSLRAKFETCRPTNPPRSTGSVEGKRKVGGKVGYLVRAFHDYREADADIVELEWPGITKNPLRLPIQNVRRGIAPRFELGSQPESPDLGCLMEDPVPIWSVKFAPTGRAEIMYGAEYPRTELAWSSFCLQEALDDIASGRSRIVRVSAVSEAGAKVRTVTSGTCAGSYWSKTWQELVLDELRGLPCFPSMSGRICGMKVSQLLADSFLVGSSDFKSATDLLNPAFTNGVLDILTEGFPGKEVVMDDNANKIIKYPPRPMRGRLGGSRVFLPNGESWELQLDPEKSALLTLVDSHSWIESKGLRYPVSMCFEAVVFEGEVCYRVPLKRCHKSELVAEKKCGQLMGQITSFNLLCLTNLACSIAACLRAGRTMEWALNSVFINGDDRLANSSSIIEAHFWAIAGPIGLKRSPGKSHESKWYASINSQDYAPIGKGRDSWTRIPVLRSGLLFGIKKLQSEEFRPSLVVDALFETVPYRFQSRLIEKFLARWGSEIKDDCRGRNLFLPVALNGMGQSAPSTWDWHITDTQLVAAERLMRISPFNSYQFGAQWPTVSSAAPRQPSWSVPLDPYDTNTVEWELAVFGRRYSLRHEKPFPRRLIQDWEWRKPDCPMAFEQTDVKNVHVGDGWDSYGTIESRRLRCYCHGTLAIGTMVPAKLRSLRREELMGCSRPTTVTVRQRETDSQLHRGSFVPSWDDRDGKKFPVSDQIRRREEQVMLSRLATKGYLPLP